MIVPTRSYGIGKRESIRKERLATQDKTRKPLIFCPRRCTQKRSRRNRLQEKKTFDPSAQTCLNCGYRKINGVKPLLFKASLLKSQEKT